MLDFRMNTFLTVCRCMNFTRASEELHITQPAVSQHIRYLEKYYGQKLFCYEGKQLNLTAAGEMLRNVSLTMVQDEKLLQNRMQQEEVKRELRFGTAAALGNFWVTEALKEYLKNDIKADDQSRVHLKLERGESDELLEKLNRDEIEFALIDGTFSKKKYECCPFEEEPMILVCSPEYTFSKKPRKVQDLFGERLLLGTKEEGTRTVLEAFWDSMGVNVRDFAKVAEIGDLHTMKELTKAGCGITFLYEAAVWEELNCGKLKEIKLKDFHVSREFRFVWKKGNQAAGQYRALFEQYGKTQNGDRKEEGMTKCYK